jgi:2-oxoisovalerate dehydrogenase E1 component alpha subunit
VQSTEPVTARAPEKDPQSLTLLTSYQAMLMARAIERRLWVLDRLQSPPHSVGRSHLGRAATNVGVGKFTLVPTGFEAVQVAAAAVLRPGTDWVVPSPVDLALCLAMGMTPLDVMLAFFARAGDPASGGRQAPGVFGSRPARVVMTSASAGRHVVQAAGIAYASKVSGTDEVTLVCTDERGTQSGDWHEGLNFAGAHALPFICLVEHRARTDRPMAQQAEGSPAARAESYGLASDTIDGGDFAAARAAFGRAADRARGGRGPTLIHASVVDLTSKSASGDLRPPEELEALASHDPIDRMRRYMISRRILDEDTDDQLQRDSAGEVAEAVKEARRSPSPAGPRALDNVFSEATGHG